MRIFAWEYVTAGGWRKCASPASLIAEGKMMLRALVGDLSRLPGIDIIVAGDPEIALGALPASVEAIDPRDRWTDWRHIIDRCDAVWPIAPETDGVLEEATRLAGAAGRTVLNSRGDALAIARSKRATAERLAASGVPVAHTVALDEPAPAGANGWVVKPDDGAGTADTYLLPDHAALARWRDDHAGGRFVVQRFVPGAPMSLSLLAQNGEAWLLTCNLQHVACERGVFAYRGGVVGGAEARRPLLEPLARRIAAALPGLWGHVGVDLIDGAEGPVVLEINPRLTTSYVGLGRSLGVNPAGLVLSLIDRPLGALVRPLAPRAVEISVPGA